MGSDKKNEQNNSTTLISLHEDHGRPTSRRDFLATGLLSFSGTLLVPSMLTVLARSGIAYGDTLVCPDDAAAGSAHLPGFINVNLAGGAALASNWIPMDAGGAPLAKYDLVGMGSAPATTTEFGGVLFPVAAANNQMLAGIRGTATAGTIAKTSFIGICVPSGDDQQTNKLDASGLVIAGGAKGAILPAKLGTRASATGVGQTAALISPPAPLIVKSLNDLTGALTPPGVVQSKLAGSKDALLKLVNNLSSSQAQTLAAANSSSGKMLSTVVQCATQKNIALSAQTNPGIDPQLDTTVGVANLWGMGSNTTMFGQSQGNRQVMAAMVYNSLKGNAAAAGIDLGGYDYHGNSRAQTDAMDMQAGQVIGLILESAAQMNQKVFIHVTSDGSVGSNSGSDGTAGFNGDRGVGGMSFIIAYNPAGRPAIKTDKASPWQLGAFKAAQASDDSTIVGTPEKAAAAVFANYAQFAGNLAMVSKVIPNQFSAADLDAVVRFA